MSETRRTVTIEQAAAWREWEASLLDEHGNKLHPWLSNVDAERLAPWLQALLDKYDWSAYPVDFEDLRRACT